jgi:glycosyltransferase involved in cell wall biosynthesis
MPKTAVIIPTYNEKENIAGLVGRIFEQNIPNLGIIFVDDGSPDGTAEEIRKHSNRFTNERSFVPLRMTSYDKPIQVIHRTAKLGLGSAYIAGFKKALADGAELIMEMDADLSHAPEDLPHFIAAVEAGADLVIGSRKIPGGKIIGWNFRRHLMSNGAMFTARLLLGLKTKDVTSGFRCFKRGVLEKIDLDAIKSNGYAFQEEMLYRTEKLGFKVEEIPVTFTDRTKGKSKLSAKDILEFFKVMLKLI